MITISRDISQSFKPQYTRVALMGPNRGKIGIIGVRVGEVYTVSEFECHGKQNRSAERCFAVYSDFLGI